MWSDNETERDFLNFTSVADTVAEAIVQSSGQPLSVGVSGAWGVGKSSMIKLIRRAVEERAGDQDGRDYLFVDFNAWLYQGFDDARAALVEVIAAALLERAEETKTGEAKVKEILKRVNWLRAAKLGVGSAIALALGLPPVGLLGDLHRTVRTLGSGKADEETLESLDQTASDLGTEGRALLRAQPSSSPPKEIQALRDSFEEALAEMNLTLVVLIDDLDRCLPPTTIKTLEAIRLLLFLRNTAFVLAADNEMIKQAARRHFEGASEKIVTSYFDKLIQVPIRVPPLGTQEVRAYLMLLFVENSTLGPDEKEEIRRRVCERLSQTWKGKRVDGSFLRSQGINLPARLNVHLDQADRLAPLMASSSQIAGNPRLIKRFLNALSLRMAISKAHDVGVDEAILAKMLLFERCAQPKAYEKIAKAVNEDAEGKARFLADWEEAAIRGSGLELLEGPWDDSFVSEWLRLPPRLADHDLRGVLYVSREQIPLVTPADRLSSEAAEILEALVSHPEMAESLEDKLRVLEPAELSTLMDRLLALARQEQEWGTPPILEACLSVAGSHPAQEARLAAFLTERPVSQIKPSIVPKIGDRSWAPDVFESWKESEVSIRVANAIATWSKDGNVAV